MFYLGIALLMLFSTATLYNLKMALSEDEVEDRVLRFLGVIVTGLVSFYVAHTLGFLG